MSCGFLTRSIKLDLFAAINNYRDYHCCAPLRYSDMLEKCCEKPLADAIKLDKTILSYIEPVGYGEIISKINKAENNVTGHLIAAYWYVQGENYDYTLEETSLIRKNFTQLIWAATNFIGIAMDMNEEGDLFVVAHLYPPGNISNMFNFNVFRRRNDKNIDQDIYEINWLVLNHINYYRRRHCLPMLNIALDLIASAQSRINELKNKLPIYDTNYPYCDLRESFFITIKSFYKFKYESVVDIWYAQGNTYDFSNPKHDIDQDNFVRMMCKETKFIGVATMIYRGYILFLAHFTPTRGSIVPKPSTK